jgi:glycogen synthase
VPAYLAWNAVRIPTILTIHNLAYQRLFPRESLRLIGAPETGFLFAQPSTESFLGGIARAFTTFVAKDRLDSMRRNAMSRSFSWDISAACYGALYRKAVSPWGQLPTQSGLRRVSGITNQIMARPTPATAASPVNATLLPKRSAA